MKKDWVMPKGNPQVLIITILSGFLDVFRLNYGSEVIEIGEGLTAFVLSHHSAYGTVPGGSCSHRLTRPRGCRG
jgi:hypothetical protein